MHNIVAQPAYKTPNFISEKCSDINVPGDEYDAFNCMVKAVALGGEVASTAAHLVLREHEETPEKCERDNNEDKVAHGV